MARTIKSHKKATNLNLTGEMEDLLGMSVGSDSLKLKSADDAAEPSEKVEKSSVAAVEATINYVNKLLNENDEDLPEDPEDQVDDEDPSLDDVEDEDKDLGDDTDDEDMEDDEVEECGSMFSEDDESLGDEEEDMDDEDLPEDDEDMPEDDEDDLEDDEDAPDDDLEEGYFREDDESLSDDEDAEDEDLPEDEDDEDLPEDDEDMPEDDDEEEDMDDVTEGYFFEGDEDLEDTDMDEPSDEEDMGAISIDIPEDVDPNDVTVSVGGSEYVPDVSDSDTEEDDEDLGDLDDDELAGDEDEDMPEDDEDAPVQEGFYPFSEGYYRLGEDDDPDVDDADPDYDEDELDDEEPEEDDFEDDEAEDDEAEDDEEESDEVTESSVMRALRRLIREGERSDDSITGDPSDSTGDSPIDSESDVDDSEAEEDDLSGDEGEVTDGDIPITPGTIQPEEAAELKWMARRLKKIMEGDDLDSHSDGEGKTAAEPLDGDAQDMIGDISDNLSDDGELTDVGNGAVEDGETTLGSPDDEDDDVEVDGDDVVSSNGEKYDTEEDEDEMLTDNYHMLMKAIKEAYSKKKKKDKKFKLKKKSKRGKKLSEGTLGDWNPSVFGGDYSNTAYNEKDIKNVSSSYADASNKTNTKLENTVLGSFNTQEMTSVLRNLNNAFGTGKIAKEVRDSSVVSEVSVPRWSLPIAENATWDSLKASKLLVETAYKSESKVNTNLLKKTHLYWENDGSKESDYKFPIASIVEGQAQIIPQAIDEATRLFASPSFITRFSETALKKIRNVLDFYNGKMGKKSPWKENKQLNVTEASKITMIDRTQYNPLMVLKRLSEQEKAKSLINLRG